MWLCSAPTSARCHPNGSCSLVWAEVLPFADADQGCSALSSTISSPAIWVSAGTSLRRFVSMIFPQRKTLTWHRYIVLYRDTLSPTYRIVRLRAHRTSCHSFPSGPTSACAHSLPTALSLEGLASAQLARKNDAASAGAGSPHSPVSGCHRFACGSASSYARYPGCV